MLRKIIREPLVHFLAGALLIFAFFWATGTGRDPADYAIRIDETDIDRLTTDWERNFRRAPTQAELDGLIDQEIAEEIYYREALRLGLDKNDPVIRRRLFTKMRFIDSEDAGNVPPTDAILQQWMDEHPGKYALPPLYDFEQIYLGQVSAAQASDQIDQLNKGTQPAAIAQPLSLPRTVKGATIEDISRQFGDRFAGQLGRLEPGQWVGPVVSGFGVHAVKITARQPGRKAVLDDVRQRVTNDWHASRQTAQKEKALARYREQYEITIAGRR
ncbi:MAG: peptidyl-prolyl cis-trans isomerase C [Parasphingorhabdus sp.]|jgi:peptidyl-prolyl cis-trans isomerase C|uniref:peptidylprolyl isomerase n=1 Tax=Parasphingorhabdus sp. TaxID=2709688 RepID=UPI0039E30FA4